MKCPKDFKPCGDEHCCHRDYECCGSTCCGLLGDVCAIQGGKKVCCTSGVAHAHGQKFCCPENLVPKNGTCCPEKGPCHCGELTCLPGTYCNNDEKCVAI